MVLALLQAGDGTQAVTTLAKAWAEQGPSAAVFGALCVACGVLFTALLGALWRMVALQGRHANELKAITKEHQAALDVMHQKLFAFATESLPTMKALVDVGKDLQLLVVEARQRTEAAARRRERTTGAHATVTPEPKKAEGA